MKSGNLIQVIVDKPTQFVRTLFRDKAAADLFLEIANYLIGKDHQLVVRTDCSTIGLSRPGERYWFYVAIGEDSLCCRFKQRPSIESYPNGSKKYYYTLCDEVAQYYAEHPEKFLIGGAIPAAGNKKATKSTPKKISDITVEPDESGFLGVQNHADAATALPKSCDTCFLRISERCCELSNAVCEDYRPGVFISQKERASWPTGGDATAGRKDHQKRYFRGQST